MNIDQVFANILSFFETKKLKIIEKHQDNLRRLISDMNDAIEDCDFQIQR